MSMNIALCNGFSTNAVSPSFLVVGQLHEVKFWASGQTCRHRE